MGWNDIKHRSPFSGPADNARSRDADPRSAPRQPTSTSSGQQAYSQVSSRSAGHRDAAPRQTNALPGKQLSMMTKRQVSDLISKRGMTLEYANWLLKENGFQDVNSDVATDGQFTRDRKKKEIAKGLAVLGTFGVGLLVAEPVRQWDRWGARRRGEDKLFAHIEAKVAQRPPSGPGGFPDEVGPATGTPHPAPQYGQWPIRPPHMQTYGHSYGQPYSHSHARPYAHSFTSAPFPSFRPNHFSAQNYSFMGPGYAKMWHAGAQSMAALAPHSNAWGHWQTRQMPMSMTPAPSQFFYPHQAAAQRQYWFGHNATSPYAQYQR